MTLRIKSIPWFKAIGALILFASWVSQNYFSASRVDELAYLDRAQILISIEEGHFSQWLGIFLVEESKNSPSDEVLRHSAFKAAQHQLNIISWATARVTDPATHDNLLIEKRELAKKLVSAYSSGNSVEVIKWLSTLTSAANSEGPKLMAAFEDRYNGIRRESEQWNKRFLILYLVGSAFVSIGLIKEWVKQKE